VEKVVLVCALLNLDEFSITVLVQLPSLLDALPTPNSYLFTMPGKLTLDAATALVAAWEKHFLTFLEQDDEAGYVNEHDDLYKAMVSTFRSLISSGQNLEPFHSR